MISDEEPINVLDVYHLVNDVSKMFKISTLDADAIMRDIYEVGEYTNIDNLRKAVFEYAQRLSIGDK